MSSFQLTLASKEYTYTSIPLQPLYVLGLNEAIQTSDRHLAGTMQQQDS